MHFHVPTHSFQRLMVAQSIDRSSITHFEEKDVTLAKLSALYFPGNSERPLKQCQNGSTIMEHKKCSLLMQKLGSEPEIPLMKFDANIQDPCFLQEIEIGFDLKAVSLFPSYVE